MASYKCFTAAESKPIIEPEPVQLESVVESSALPELVVVSEQNSSSEPNSYPEPEYKL